MRTAEEAHIEGGGEALRLGQPVAGYRGRRHDQCRARGRPMQQQGQGLQGLAQAHVVGQAGPGRQWARRF